MENDASMETAVTVTNDAGMENDASMETAVTVTNDAGTENDASVETAASMTNGADIPADVGAAGPDSALGSEAREEPREFAGASNSGRHIPAALKRAVWERDQGRCTFVDSCGCRCRETGLLEFHHEQSFAKDTHPLAHLPALATLARRDSR
jgi:hypothetical protein